MTPLEALRSTQRLGPDGSSGSSSGDGRTVVEEVMRVTVRNKECDIVVIVVVVVVIVVAVVVVVVVVVVIVVDSSSEISYTPWRDQ